LYPRVNIITSFSMKVFMYQWHLEDDPEQEEYLSVRGYGINEQGNTVCLHVKRFMPWLYVEIQSKTPWLDRKTTYMEKVKERCMAKPFSIQAIHRQRLYGYNGQKTNVYLKLYFQSQAARKSASYRLQNFNSMVYGKPTRFLCHEFEASALLQFVCKLDLPTAGWIEFGGREKTKKHTPLEKEYEADMTRVFRVKEDFPVPEIVVFSFDIEVYSTNPNRMPDATIEGDCIFQISVVLGKGNQVLDRVLLTLGSPDRRIVGGKIRVEEFASEIKLLLGFQRLLRSSGAHVIVGYNIMGFDIPYMMDRAERCGIKREFDVWGIPSSHCPVKEVHWSSAAYSFQDFRFFECEGRITVDLLPLIKREYKFSNYKLKTVSTFFLGETKDPLTPQDIFKAYREHLNKNPESRKLLAECGKYCVQDAHLVWRLFQRLETWVGLVEMANICNVPVMALYTQGQQIKVFSQVYKKCHQDGVLVQSAKSLPPELTFSAEKGYVGAFVFPPKPGIYEHVVPFDFSSLYPTTIIAYNIDYSTFVMDESVPDEDCHVIEWEEHSGCEHDPEKGKKITTKVCERYRYRFRREPIGVIPGLLKALLQQRSETRKRIKTLRDPTLKTVLDKRQLAYKVSANSMYGAMGVQKGYIPFLPGAMCTTAIGRMSIHRAAEHVRQHHNGLLVYGDTDSIYCHFSGLYEMKDIWQKAKQLEKEFCGLFPDPMRLIFEEKIYRTFLILTKKRYMAYTCNEKGEVDEDLTSRGVLLARRDNCLWIRRIYEKVVRQMMDHLRKETILDGIHQEILHLFQWQRPSISDFVSSKLVGKDYKIRPPPTDDVKLKKRLEELKIKWTVHREEWMKEYREKCQPPHVQLASKMKKRGQPIEAGTRIEYVVLENEEKSKLNEKMEDPYYYRLHCDVLRLDCLYYTEALSKPLDQILEIVYGLRGYTKTLLGYHRNHQKIIHQIHQLQEPVLRFVD